MRACVVAIVPAAGCGKRLGLREKKPFVLLAGKPLITYSLRALESCGLIDDIIVAAQPGSIKRLKSIIKKNGFKKVRDVVKGGKTRSESVRNCFKKIDPSCNIVLIHDGARPFPGTDAIRDSINLAGKFGQCVTAIPETDTIKLSDKNLFVKKTLDRSRLWRAQTPQAFRYDVLNLALKRISDFSNLTDDSSILERAGKKVKIVEGSIRNIKITTKEDLKIAEAFL